MAQFAFDPSRYPTGPGCYLMKDESGRVIYVGKARVLRHRLASYFQPHAKEWRVARLVARVADIEVILVNTEAESLVLENNLIKKWKPRYNQLLVDEDSGYYYIVLTDEEFPRLVAYRKNRTIKELEGVPDIRRQFGPFVTRRFRDVLLRFAIENFGLRTCHPMPRKACLRYHMSRCGGACESRVSAADYAAAAAQAAAFLARPPRGLIRQMRRRMMEFARQLEFERAQRIKEQIAAMEAALEQQIVERDVKHNQDVIYFGSEQALVLEIKRGAVVGLRLYPLEHSLEHSQACERLILSLYSSGGPQELIVNQAADPGRLEQALCAASGQKSKIVLPVRGIGLELLKLCEKNFEYRCS